MTKRQVQVTYEDLSTRFDKPLSDVAVELGVCMTFIKKACRKHGIKRWPFRKVQTPTSTCLHKLDSVPLPYFIRPHLVAEFRYNFLRFKRNSTA